MPIRFTSFAKAGKIKIIATNIDAKNHKIRKCHNFVSPNHAKNKIEGIPNKIATIVEILNAKRIAHPVSPAETNIPKIAIINEGIKDDTNNDAKCLISILLRIVIFSYKILESNKKYFASMPIL